MYIQVKVKTSQKHEGVEEVGINRLVVSVKVKPERNLANQRLITLVAEHLTIPLKQIKITSGHTQPTKLLSIIED